MSAERTRDKRTVKHSRTPTRGRRPLSGFILHLALGGLALVLPGSALAAKCLFVSSYHPGYSWTAGEIRGLRSALGERCELREFHLDSKRRHDRQQLSDRVTEASTLIQSWRPDVVIVADDPAVTHLLQPLPPDPDTPFVFCGVNWNIEDYRLARHQVTGMIEVAPVQAMLDRVMHLQANHKRGLYIAANTASEVKDFRHHRQIAADNGITLDYQLVDTAEEWLRAYTDGQGYDFVILGNNLGIEDWDEKQVLQTMLPLTRRLSVTTMEWMMPYSMLGFTRIPEEQGEWAGLSALAILDGLSPEDIPIIPNRRWEIWSNALLLGMAGIELPQGLKMKAKGYGHYRSTRPLDAAPLEP